jgi:hypothetical protein
VYNLDMKVKLKFNVAVHFVVEKALGLDALKKSKA